MKGNAKVIVLLNGQLQAELMANQQYMVHAGMQANWGYTKLAEHSVKEALEESIHARRLIDRILFLEGEPEVGMKLDVTIAADVPAQHKADLKAEIDAVKTYNAAASEALAVGDNASRDLFASILHDEEDHVNWLETQLGLIEELGLEVYLAEQIG